MRQKRTLENGSNVQREVGNDVLNPLEVGRSRNNVLLLLAVLLLLTRRRSRSRRRRSSTSRSINTRHNLLQILLCLIFSLALGFKRLQTNVLPRCHSIDLTDLLKSFGFGLVGENGKNGGRNLSSGVGEVAVDVGEEGDVGKEDGEGTEASGLRSEVVGRCRTWKIWSAMR